MRETLEKGKGAVRKKKGKHLEKESGKEGDTGTNEKGGRVRDGEGREACRNE